MLFEDERKCVPQVRLSEIPSQEKKYGFYIGGVES